MRGFRRLLLTLLLLFSLSSCAGTPPLPPLILYQGDPRPTDEIATIRVVRTHPTRGDVTIDVREIVRVGNPSLTVFQATEDAGWQIPDHFAGLPESGQGAAHRDPGDIPDQFQVLPGRYRVRFRHMPMRDEWGWKHIPRGESTTTLECRAGFVYLLEGRLLEDEGGWLLDSKEVPAGEGGGDQKPT